MSAAHGIWIAAAGLGSFLLVLCAESWSQRGPWRIRLAWSAMWGLTTGAIA
ncbi:MAG: hypothetical protein GF355_09445, partial [Candidatus Eisenbacteria bacterium]|nr:hypothetical protein [Candidatus Eisenbacteria bacterium]